MVIPSYFLEILQPVLTDPFSYFLLQFDNIFFSVLYEQKREFKRENLNKVHLQIKEFFDYDKNLQLL